VESYGRDGDSQLRVRRVVSEWDAIVVQPEVSHDLHANFQRALWRCSVRYAAFSDPPHSAVTLALGRVGAAQRVRTWRASDAEVARHTASMPALEHPMLPEPFSKVCVRWIGVAAGSRWLTKRACLCAIMLLSACGCGPSSSAAALAHSGCSEMVLRASRQHPHTCLHCHGTLAHHPAPCSAGPACRYQGLTCANWPGCWAAADCTAAPQLHPGLEMLC
jgi:hypothetical protein